MMHLASAAACYKELKPSARGGLAAFLAYTQVEDTSALKAEDAVGFLNSLTGRGCAPATIRRYKTTINGFLRWLLEENLLSFDAKALQQAFLDQGAILPRRVEPRRVGPQEDDVRALLEAAYAARPAAPPCKPRGLRSHLTYLRNIAVVETLRATGACPRELVALRRRDLDEENQVARAPDGRLLYFDLASWAALARYFEARRDPVHCPVLLRQVPLFARHGPRSAGQGPLPLDVSRVAKILKDLRATDTLTTQALRTRFAQRLLDATGDEKGTARLLGLKSLQTLRRYRSP